MCQPDVTFTQPPAWGQGTQFGRGRWAAAAAQGNVPNTQQQWGLGMGRRWNTGNVPASNMGTGPANVPQNTWGQGMRGGMRRSQGMVGVSGSGYNQQYPAGGAMTGGMSGGRSRGRQSRGGRGGFRNW